MDPTLASAWWETIGAAVGAGALIGAVVSVVNSWGPSGR